MPTRPGGTSAYRHRLRKLGIRAPGLLVARSAYPKQTDASPPQEKEWAWAAPNTWEWDSPWRVFPLVQACPCWSTSGPPDSVRPKPPPSGHSSTATPSSSRRSLHPVDSSLPGIREATAYRDCGSSEHEPPSLAQRDARFPGQCRDSIAAAA